jgi:hypothetical protein
MGSVLVIGTSQGVVALGEGDAEWKLLGQGLTGRAVQCLSVDLNGGFWAGTAANGLARCQDLADWQPVVNNLSGASIHSLAFHPAQPGIVLCGTAPAALQLSLDGGHTLQELPMLRQHPGAGHWTYPSAPYRSRLHRLFLHPRDSNVLVAGVLTGGVYVSGDVGQTWHERQAGVGRHILDLTMHPGAPSRLYAATPIGFSLSDDFGETWQERTSGLAYPYVTAIATYPTEPDIVFLAAHKNAQGGGGVYRTQNAGTRWEPCAGLPYEPQLLYTSLVVGHNRLIVGTNRGDVYQSRDLGSTWGKIRAALPPIHCLKLAEAPVMKGA